VTAAPGRVTRILAIRRKALGDALVTLPAVQQLLAAFPAARLDLVIDRPFAPLLQDLASDLDVITWPHPDGHLAWLRHLFGRPYDLVVDFLGSPRTAVWTALSGAPLRVGYELPRRSWAYNVRVPRNRTGRYRLVQFAGEAFLDPLRALGLAPPPWQPGAAAGLGVPATALGERYRQWLDGWRPDGPTVALVFSATWPAKAWPPRHAGALVRLLTERGLAPLVVPGPGDDALVDGIRTAAPEAPVAPPTTLAELTDLLGRCRAMVGTDGGARHLAALLGVPTVTLFGPTDPGGWNPDHPRHVAVTNPVPCAPCDLTRCPVPGHPCLDDLAPPEVADALDALLARTDARGFPGGHT
jgi:ADP-heptose:LPS heptosyltransferase